MEKKKLVEFYNHPDARFVIPMYQRRYAWEPKHCERLFSDILKLHYNSSIKDHFIGSLVTYKDDSTGEDFIIIDGQQRLTTISLLILAAYNAVENGVMKNDFEEDLVEVKRQYLITSSSVARKHDGRDKKLKPIAEDEVAFDKLFTKDSESFIKDSTLTKNYNLFYDKITKSDMTFQQLMKAIGKLWYIHIDLNQTDNPQLIFESLNSCGKDLEESDKVRNFLLMDMDFEIQTECYNNYWHEIEKSFNFNEKLISNFIRDYLTVKTRKIYREDTLYLNFKEKIPQKFSSNQEILKDMLSYARIASKVSDACWDNRGINTVLTNLNILGNTVIMPFLLSFLHYAQNPNTNSEDYHYSNIGTEEIVKVLKTTESFLARRIIASKPANALSNIFASLHNDVMKVYENYKNTNKKSLEFSYSEILNFVLLKKVGNAAYPNDEEILEGVSTKNVYNLPPKQKQFLFYRLETEDSPEGREDIVPKMQKGDLSIEHIMPQHLTLKWEEALSADGSNPKEVQLKYRDTLANLTLTGYNSDYSNRTFQEKKKNFINNKGKLVLGFDESHIHLSNTLKHKEKWTKVELEEREKEMQERVLRLWPMITSQYCEEVTEIENFNFNNDYEVLTGRKPKALAFYGNIIPVESWKDFLVKICQLVDQIDPVAIPTLASTSFSSFKNDKKDGYDKVNENYYVINNTSTSDKCKVITQLFQEAGIPLDELEVELHPQVSID